MLFKNIKRESNFKKSSVKKDKNIKFTFRLYGNIVVSSSSSSSSK